MGTTPTDMQLYVVTVYTTTWIFNFKFKQYMNTFVATFT